MIHTSVSAQNNSKDIESQQRSNAGIFSYIPPFAIKASLIAIIVMCSIAFIYYFKLYFSPPSPSRMSEEYVPFELGQQTLYRVAKKDEIEKWYSQIEKVAKEGPQDRDSLFSSYIRKVKDVGNVPLYFEYPVGQKTEEIKQNYLALDEKKNISDYNEMLARDGIKSKGGIIATMPYLLLAYRGDRILNAEEPLRGVTKFVAISLSEDTFTEDMVRTLGGRLYHIAQALERKQQRLQKNK